MRDLAVVLLVLVVLATPFGLTALAAGLILRLCEWGWDEPPDRMGSRSLLIAGAVLCSPVLVLLVLYAIDRLAGP